MLSLSKYGGRGAMFPSSESIRLYSQSTSIG